jgi:hypothetical protein
VAESLDLFAPAAPVAVEPWVANLSPEERVWFDQVVERATCDVLTDRQAEIDRISRARVGGLEIVDNNGKRVWFRRGSRAELQACLGKGRPLEGFTVDEYQGAPVLRVATEPKTVSELGAYEKKKASTTGPRRLMTEAEITTILRLSECSFSPGSWDKRFVHDMVHEASQLNPLITEKQAAQLPRLAQRYRKQLAALTEAAHG